VSGLFMRFAQADVGQTLSDDAGAGDILHTRFRFI
jgi:hypothetical protein